MLEKPDFDAIKEEYEKNFKSTQGRRNDVRLYPDVCDWMKTLNEVQYNVYCHIKYVGVYLYPLYPIGQFFIDFGNPHIKVGIEIFYKNHGEEQKRERLDYFKSEGWTVYTIDSKNTYRDAYHFWDEVKAAGDDRDLTNVVYGERKRFNEANKDNNAQCLVEYIKDIHYKDFFPNSHLEEEYEE